MTRRRRSIGLAIPAILAVALLGACSSSKKPTASTNSTATSSSSTATSVDSTTSSAPDGVTTTSTCTLTSDGAKKETEAGTRATLVAVRIGAQPCSDRVVFEMKQAGPAALHYTVETAKPPFVQDGSGKTVTVKGNVFVKVVIRDASGFDFETGKNAYTGPETVPGTRRIVEARRTGDFEGVLNWVIGLNGAFPFRVQVLGAPLRLVIDFEGG